MNNTENDIRRYSEIGFMCGLEIHQRLSTPNKLFCSCSSRGEKENTLPEAEISRYQRAVAGEMGETDRSAEFEEKRKAKFIYHIHNDTTCLVDIDEEPPHQLNMDALSTALCVAKSLYLTIPDELEPMRKEVVDGSNPSAFQRTIKMGLDGKLEVNGRNVVITGMMLEEESAGIISKSQSGTTYDTSRIGIPLVEIDTDPYLRSPTEARDAALRIGLLLRLTGKVQRGIGSIRQDVNVSIKGGARTEIKGLQEVSSLDKFVENEIQRQQALIQIKDEVIAKKIGAVGKTTDLSNILGHTTVRIIQNELKNGGIVLGFKVSGFNGLLGREINPQRRLGSEVSDYAKMGGVKGIIHSDEHLEGYGFTMEEIRGIKEKLSISEKDAFILIAGSSEKVSIATDFAIQRVKLVQSGVPLETRGVSNADLYTTRFMRPLPSGSRMYPETDLHPVEVTKTMLDEAQASAPNPEKEEKTLLKDIGNAATAKQLMLSPYYSLYKSITSLKNIDKQFVANVLLQKFTELRRSGFSVEKISEDRLLELFTAYSERKITKQGVEEALKEISKNDVAISELLKTANLLRISGKDLEKIVKEFMAKSSDADKNSLIRNIMGKYRINIDGEELHATLEKLIKWKQQ